MPVVSIVGTSGVGKSYVVKQLASLNCAAAYFEGEQGVIPPWVFASIITGDAPVKRWRWFIDRYQATLERAHVVSDAGLLCFVDGAVMSAEAILLTEPARVQNDLQAMIDAIKHCTSDVTVVLVASEQYLRTQIAKRGRTEEQPEVVVQRALALQKKFLELATDRERVIVVDRSDIDYGDSAALVALNDRIQSLL